MAKELFNSDFYTLPEQVQLNKEDIETLKTKIDTNTNSIDSIKQLYLLKTDASNTYATKTELSSYLSIADASNTYLTKSYASSNYLTIHDAFNIYLNKTDASNTYLTKTDASNTYAKKDGLFSALMTTAGLAKIHSDVTIGTSITLIKDADFNIENIIGSLDGSTKTFLFELAEDANQNFISRDIKLDLTGTAIQTGAPLFWITGMGVFSLGNPTGGGSAYLCNTSCMIGVGAQGAYISNIVITPLNKLYTF